MAENNAPPEAPAKKGKLKLILMLTVVLVLAVGLSVLGTMWFLGGGIPGMGDAEQ
ncbi:MAG: flagellar basal body protein FliL, partial [Marinobacter sp.]